MIHFSCIYCGRALKANHALVGKKVKCPECGHSIFIPAQKALDAREKRGQQRGGEQETALEGWRNKSDQEIAALLSHKPLTKKDDDRLVLKRQLSPLLPRYDDLTLFALSAALLGLVPINSTLRSDLRRLFTLDRDLRILVMLGLASIGMVLSLCGVLLKRPKGNTQKRLMLLFAVVVTAGTGAYAGLLMFERSEGWLIVFPLWNLVSSILLGVLFFTGVLDIDRVTGKRATLLQVGLTVLTVGVLLVICQYVFELLWVCT